MSMPGGAVATFQGNPNPPDRVVVPTAVSSAKSGAIFDLGEVLKTVVHRAGAFLTEPDIDNAVSVIDRFVATMVPGSELPALLTGAERAMKEDVSLRTPPGGAAMPAAFPGLDYNKLAQALIAEQRRLQLEAEGSSQS